MEVWYLLSDGGADLYKPFRNGVTCQGNHGMCWKTVNSHGSCSVFVAIAGDYGGVGERLVLRV